MNIKLLKDLNFAEKINAIEPVTEAGKDMLKNYRSYLYSNPATCGLVNGFISEAQKFSFDTGMISILESVLSYVKENNISWKLATVCESITNNPSTYNYIAKVGVNQVEKLLNMNEAEVVSYIKAGALKGVQYIPEFRNICKEVYKTTITEVKNLNYTVTNPVSYVMVNEDGQYFKVLGKTFKIKDNQVSEAVNDDVKFNRINMLLESFTRNDLNLEYSFKSGFNTFSFSLNENELTLSKSAQVGQAINEKFENSVKFREYCDTISRTMGMNEKLNFLNITNAISEVFENMNNVVVLDCTKILSTNGNILAITEAKDNVNLTVFRSIHNGTSTKNYDFMIEALKDTLKITGVDLKHIYEERIDEDCKKENPEEYQKIQEELKESKKAVMEARKKKIAMLAEKYKNDPARIALLNKTARELAILEAEEISLDEKKKKKEDEAEEEQVEEKKSKKCPKCGKEECECEEQVEEKKKAKKEDDSEEEQVEEKKKSKKDDDELSPDEQLEESKKKAKKADKEVEDAEEAVEEAKKKAKKADKEVEDAEEEVTEAKKKAKKAENNLKDAEEELEEAKKKAKKAKDDEEDAEEEQIEESKKKSKKADEEVEDAEQEVEEAKKKSKKAEDNLEDAEEQLEESKKKAKKCADEVEDAEEQLEEAKKKAKKAADEVEDAENAVEESKKKKEDDSEEEFDEDKKKV